MPKRSKFIIVSLLLAIMLWMTQWVEADNRVQAIIAVSVVTYVLAAWALFEDLKGIEWLTILSLPVLYTFGAGLFSFFLPNNVPRILGVRLNVEAAMMVASVVRLLFWIGYGIGFYALMLTENIFSVAAIRTIQLLRAAHAVGFLLTLITGLFFYQALFSFRLPFYVIVPGVFVVTFLLFLQGNWSMQLKEGVGQRVILYSAIPSFISAQLALVLAFWPIEPLTAALCLVSFMYVMLGLSQQYIAGRLFRNQMIEYLVVAIVVLLSSVYITKWR